MVTQLSSRFFFLFFFVAVKISCNLISKNYNYGLIYRPCNVLGAFSVFFGGFKEICIKWSCEDYVELRDIWFFDGILNWIDVTTYFSLKKALGGNSRVSLSITKHSEQSSSMLKTFLHPKFMSSPWHQFNFIFPPGKFHKNYKFKKNILLLLLYTKFK